MSNNSSKLTKEEIIEFPPIEEYKKKLAKLFSTDLSHLNQREIHDFYFDHAIILPNLISYQVPSHFNLVKYFRVRLNIDESIENIHLSRTFSYPPQSICSQNGRANIKNQSVFYCSNFPEAAIIESKPKEGDIAYLSIWKTAARSTVRFNVCLPPILKQKNGFNQMAYEMWQTAKNLYSNESKELYQHLLELNKYIVNCYINEKSPYTLSSWLSDQILYREGWRDAIIYPSIASIQKYCNVAFHPNSVDQHLIIEKVFRLRINSVNGIQIAFNIGPVGELQNTNIHWREANDNEKRFIEQQFKKI